jgi:hypothetical protein
VLFVVLKQRVKPLRTLRAQRKRRKNFVTSPFGRQVGGKKRLYELPS